MKVDLNWIFKGLDGEEVKSKSTDPEQVKAELEVFHAGRNVASQLGSSRENENVVKFWEWALKLYKKEVLELDKQDVNLLKSFVEKNQTLTVLAKAQILLALSETKE